MNLPSEAEWDVPRRMPTALLTWAVVLVMISLVLSLVGLKLAGSPIITPADPYPSVPESTLSTLADIAYGTLGYAYGDYPPGFTVPTIYPGNPGRLRLPAGYPPALPAVLLDSPNFSAYSATASWPIVIALSRFGIFGHLTASSSAPDGTFPLIQGFSFDNMSYTSGYIAFGAVVEMSSDATPDPYTGYASLPYSEPLARLARRYDTAPYVPRSLDGATPFLDIDNMVFISGSLVPPSTMEGASRSAILTGISQAAAYASTSGGNAAGGAAGFGSPSPGNGLTTPGSIAPAGTAPGSESSGKASSGSGSTITTPGSARPSPPLRLPKLPAPAGTILTAANLITASICLATSDQPAFVCKSPAVTQAARVLDSAPAPGED